MKKRKWTDQEKFQIALEGLRGEITVSELCTRHQISQGTYYKWRDLLLSEGHRAFSAKKTSKREELLEQDNSTLLKMVGNLTMELKKNGW